MKKILAFIMVAALLLSLCACGCEHEWEEICGYPKTCKICGKSEGEIIQHSFHEATCTAPMTCSICGATQGDPLHHTVENWEIKQASCSEEGTKSGICTTCGSTIQEIIPKEEHSPGDWVVTEEASISKMYVTKTRSCTVCGEQLETTKFKLTDQEKETIYKSACSVYKYTDIARDPDKYKGTYAKYTGKIIQVLENGNYCELRVNITKGKYSYSDTIYVTYTRKDGESRLLEDDIVTIYGNNAGLITYETIFGGSITIPQVYASYIETH